MRYGDLQYPIEHLYHLLKQNFYCPKRAMIRSKSPNNYNPGCVLRQVKIIIGLLDDTIQLSKDRW